MLKQAEEAISISKEQYKAQYKQLGAKLGALQQQTRAQGIPIVIVFEGWSAAGKGSRISDLIMNFDPRGYVVQSTRGPIGNQSRLPFMARFWDSLCAHGGIEILDRAWYTAAFDDMQGSKKPKSTLLSRLADIRAFEKQLCEDGYVLVKFFLHISKKVQAKRLKKLTAHSATVWRVSKQDQYNNKHYQERFDAMDTLLEMSNHSFAPWVVVNTEDQNYANLQIAKTLLSTMERALERNKHPQNTQGVDVNTLQSRFTLVKVPCLHEVRHDLTLDDERYDEQLKALQKRLKDLHNLLYLKKIPMVIAYEGHDAAGKGGNIKRIASALDARGYQVHPICAPTDVEKAHPYLWRFWTKLPLDGHIAIFDRTWYGRVLVERIEELTPQSHWQAAYDQINEFEYQLYKWGAIIQKFWVDVSMEEQLRRFEDRQNTPQKQWKITQEDWRNREKFPEYVVAVNDMLRLTSTDFAPWTVIESDDKQYARIKALRSVIAAIEKRL